MQILIFIIIILTATNLDDVKMEQHEKQHKIIIYTKSYCPYCVRAKQLLKNKNLEYQEIDVEHDQELFEQMLDKSNGQKTVPQIFINGKHIGGCSDLYELDKNKELDKIVGI